MFELISCHFIHQFEKYNILLKSNTWDWDNITSCTQDVKWQNVENFKTPYKYSSFPPDAWWTSLLQLFVVCCILSGCWTQTDVKIRKCSLVCCDQCQWWALLGLTFVYTHQQLADWALLYIMVVVVVGTLTQMFTHFVMKRNLSDFELKGVQCFLKGSNLPKDNWNKLLLKKHFQYYTVFHLDRLFRYWLLLLCFDFEI